MRLKFVFAVFSGVIFAALPVVVQAAGPATCESLAGFHAANVTITTAAAVDSPAAVGRGLGPATTSAPLCRVNGFLTPTSDSHIGFEVWLPPASVWNHKYEAVGNGGLSGALNYRAMLPAFNRGYATMTTDLGHTTTSVEDAGWAMGHPEKVVDYEYRAEHLSAVTATQIIEAYYGSAPAHSYYSGCSAGGIQGLTEVLRFPKDFDGYIVGDATPDHFGQEIGALWNTLAASLANEAEALKPAQISLAHKAILQQCAGKDGGVASDPFLSNPTACKFEPKTLQCTAGQDPSTCLSPAQVAEFDRIYQGPVNPRTHEPIEAGMTFGSEAGWDRYFAGKKNPAGTDRPWAGFLVDMVYNDPDYLSQQKYLSFDFDKEYTAVRQRMVAGETLDSSWNTRNRDLDAFKAGGGKLIQYHGWDDPNIPALEAVNLFNAVVADQAKRHKLTPQQALDATQQFYRLFMVQGMGHCSGGDGPSNFGQSAQTAADAEHDTLTALEQWVEKGVAPEKFIGSKAEGGGRGGGGPDGRGAAGGRGGAGGGAGAVSMTRPICAWPKNPVYKGSGSTDDAGNFTCANNPQPQAKGSK
jgi:feruloyl esterase